MSAYHYSPWEYFWHLIASYSRCKQNKFNSINTAKYYLWAYINSPYLDICISHIDAIPYITKWRQWVFETNNDKDFWSESNPLKILHILFLDFAAVPLSEGIWCLMYKCAPLGVNFIAFLFCVSNNKTSKVFITSFCNVLTSLSNFTFVNSSWMIDRIWPQIQSLNIPKETPLIIVSSSIATFSWTAVPSVAVVLNALLFRVFCADCESTQVLHNPLDNLVPCGGCNLQLVQKTIVELVSKLASLT